MIEGFAAEDEHQQASLLWDKTMLAVKDAVINTIGAEVKAPTQAQLDFWHNMCAEQLYHAGWNGLAALSDLQAILKEHQGR